ncbi:hypothetical protein MBANPS3_005218 [Mucor bainieri]
MSSEKIKALSEDLASQDSTKKYDRIIGFDLGASALSCSFSTDKTPRTAAVFQDWVNGSRTESLFPACIQYKNWSTTNYIDRRVGFEARPKQNPVGEGDFYIPSIQDYVVQWITSQGARDDQPDAMLVLRDFFHAVRIQLENAFKRWIERQEGNYSQLESESAPCSLDECQFYFALPQGLSSKSQYVDLVAKAFKQAGFLKKDDYDNRLGFLDDNIAVGHSCLATFQKVGDRDTNYLVVEIGHKTFEFGVIQCRKSTLTSSVSQITDTKVMKGYYKFSDNFRNYITSMPGELDISQTDETDALVAAFERLQKSDVDFSDTTGKTEFIGLTQAIAIDNSDLQENVFRSHLNTVFDFIVDQCHTYRVERIIFRAQYCEGPCFYMTCENFVRDNQEKYPRNIPECVVWDKSKHMVSDGAVLYPLQIQDPTSAPLEVPAQILDLPKGHFAVGIDFGTTFSGCSYADISGTLKPGENRVIETMGSWDLAYTYPKISTALKFNEGSGKFSESWGYDVAKKKMKMGDLKLEYFKLLLSPERFYGKGNREIKEVQDKYFMFDLNYSDSNTSPWSTKKSLTPVDIIAKYLENLNSRIKEHLSKQSGVKAKSLKIKYVITVPAMWTSTGRDTMINAAIKAGLVKSNEDNSIQLITEPMAAALSCEKYLKDILKPESYFHTPGLVFTVLDAGGGTVDVVTFDQTFIKTEDGKYERSIKQIGEGTGDTCGAAYLETRFRQAIVDFYTETMGIRVKGEGFFDHHVEYFKKEIKDNFMPSSRHDAVYKIKLPPLPVIPPDTRPALYKESVYLLGLKPRCRLIENNTVFEISVAEVKRCIFNPIVERAVKVLKTHLEKTSNNRPSAVLMVGGFSQSKYLQQIIQNFCAEENIVAAPPGGVTAISRGAVSYFLEPRLVSEKMAPSGYLPNPPKKPHQSITDMTFQDRKSGDESLSALSSMVYSQPYSSTFDGNFINAESSTVYSYPHSSNFDDQMSGITRNTDLSNEPRKPGEIQGSQQIKRSVDYSMYYYFVGIDIGSNSISCSYTNLYNQTEVHSITEWAKTLELESEHSDSILLLEQQELYFERYPACILYKDVNRPDQRILCGYDALLAPKTVDDLFIPNIKNLLNNTFAHNQSFEANHHGLTVDTIVKDFMKGFLKQLHLLLLDNICQDLQSQLAQDIKIISDHEDYILKADISDRMQDVQPVLSVPDGLLDNSQFSLVYSVAGEVYIAVEDIISEAFTESGVFGPNIDSKRLRFTHSADAAAYTCLSRPRYLNEIKLQQHYLVCDIGYTSATFSKIEKGSTVPLNSIRSIGNLAGAETINHYFKKYLNDNKKHYGITSEKQVEDLVVNFSKKNLTTIFDLSEEEEAFVHVSARNAPYIRVPVNRICNMVVKEFLEDIIRKLDELHTEDPQIDKIFMFGRYHRTQLFWEQVTNFNKDPTLASKIVSFDGDSAHDISSGAVRHGINSESRSSQFPDHDSYDQPKTKFAEPPLEDFNILDDFVLGIDLGNILFGCSYKTPSKNVQIVKTWPSELHNEDGRIPAALVVKTITGTPPKTVCWGNEAKNAVLQNHQRLVEGMKLYLCRKDTTKFYKNDFFKGQDGHTLERLLGEYPTLTEDNFLDLTASYLKNVLEIFIKSQEVKKEQNLYAVQTAPPTLARVFRKGGKVKKGQNLYVVLTAPSMWSTFTRRKVMEKAIQERIVGKKDKLKIKIISELEAVAIAYEPYLSRLHKNNTPLTFIVADIGGQTADVCTFQLSSKGDTQKNLIRTVSSLNDDRGGICGASFLEKRFKDLVADIYHNRGKIATKGLELAFDFYAKHFINQLKKNHFNRQVMIRSICFEIPLPKLHCQLLKDRGNYNGFIDPVLKKLRIPYQDIKDDVFDPLVKQITALIKVQVEKRGAKVDAEVDAIVLVGGFLNSTYLQEEIKKTLSEPLRSNLIIDNPEDALYNRSTCVSYGAASYFMNSKLLSHTYANQSYAMSVGDKHAKDGKSLMCIVRKNDYVKGNIYQHLVHVAFPNDAKFLQVVKAAYRPVEA